MCVCILYVYRCVHVDPLHAHIRIYIYAYVYVYIYTESFLWLCAFCVVLVMCVCSVIFYVVMHSQLSVYICIYIYIYIMHYVDMFDNKKLSQDGPSEQASLKPSCPTVMQNLLRNPIFV